MKSYTITVLDETKEAPLIEFLKTIDHLSVTPVSDKQQRKQPLRDDEPVPGFGAAPDWGVENTADSEPTIRKQAA